MGKCEWCNQERNNLQAYKQFDKEIMICENCYDYLWNIEGELEINDKCLHPIWERMLYPNSHVLRCIDCGLNISENETKLPENAIIKGEKS